MRHVALLTTSYPDGSPGTEAAGSFVADFAFELSKHAQVTVIAAGSTNTTERFGTLTVIRFAVPRLPLSLLNPLLPHHWVLILRTLRAGEQALHELAVQAIPDHILALWALPSGYWAKRFSRQHNVRFSVWALGSDIWGLGRIPVVRWILRRVLRCAEHRYADGILLASDVEKLCGLGCEFLPSTRVLPRLDEVRKAASAPYKLAFLGRWHPNKGVDLLLDALGQLGNAEWGGVASLRICGGGPLEKQVHAAAAELCRQGRPVTVEGYMDKEAAASLIQWADYLLLPSRIESIPVVFSDAVQLRTAIVCTPVGDLPRLQEQYRFGIVARETSAAAYRDAIRNALGKNAAEFGPALEAASKDFDLAAIVQRFLRDTAKR